MIRTDYIVHRQGQSSQSWVNGLALLYMAKYNTILERQYFRDREEVNKFTNTFDVDIIDTTVEKITQDKFYY